jgi:hypothetical protein
MPYFFALEAILWIPAIERRSRVAAEIASSPSGSITRKSNAILAELNYPLEEKDRKRRGKSVAQIPTD